MLSDHLAREERETARRVARVRAELDQMTSEIERLDRRAETAA